MRFDRLNISSPLVKNAKTLQDRGTKKKEKEGTSAFTYAKRSFVFNGLLLSLAG